MAELSNIETKLAEVIGLAMAAQDATQKIAKLVDDPELAGQLKTMKAEAAMAEKDGTRLASDMKGKKAAILREARSAKKKAASMMSDYLEKNSDALDGFEFMTMAEAGEVGHWAVLGEMAKATRNGEVRSLVSKHLPIQKRHFRDTQAGSLKLAREEAAQEAASDGGASQSSGRGRSSTRSSTRSRSTTAKSASTRKSTSSRGRSTGRSRSGRSGK